MTIEELISAWPYDPNKGSQRVHFARDVGQTPDAVRHWVRRGHVPRPYRFAVSEAARIRGVLTPDGKPVTVEALYAMAGEYLPRAAIAEQGAA